MNKPKLSYYAKRFVLFFLALFILNFIRLFICQNPPGISWTKILMKVGIPFSLAIIMSRSTYSPDWKVTTLLTIILVYLNCIALIAINFWNPFHRIITAEDYRSGIALDLLFHTLFYLPVSLILAIVFRKRRDYFVEEESSDVLDS